MSKIIPKISTVSVLLIASLAQGQDPGQPVPPAPSANMGKAIFEQTGANSCMHCHGIDGTGGKVAAAAKLAHAKTWRGYKGTKGDLAALKANVLALIKNGAALHNAGYKAANFDWKAAGGPYDSQMLGLGGSPSAAWMKRMKERGVTKDIAAESLWLHIVTLEKDGVLK